MEGPDDSEQENKERLPSVSVFSVTETDHHRQESGYRDLFSTVLKAGRAGLPVWHQARYFSKLHSKVECRRENCGLGKGMDSSFHQELPPGVTTSVPWKGANLFLRA